MEWLEPKVPRHVIQVLPVDTSERLLVMHRTDKVRSAKNVWSFPSGMQEIGENLLDTIKREMEEEYSLKGILGIDYLGQYENMIDGYHWVITVVVAVYEDVTKAINNEPDKHDQMVFVSIHELLRDEFWTQYQFHSSFHDWACYNRFNLFLNLDQCIKQ